jgi:glycosyltransferase involved in cell wall biosynthesis
MHNSGRNVPRTALVYDGRRIVAAELDQVRECAGGMRGAPRAAAADCFVCRRTPIDLVRRYIAPVGGSDGYESGDRDLRRDRITQSASHSTDFRQRPAGDCRHDFSTVRRIGRPRRLRVLTLLDTLQPGGAERLAVTVVAHLDRERFDPVVCVSRRDTRSPLREILDAAAVPLVTVDRTHRAALWSWRALATVLRTHRIDVLHAHMFGSNVWGTVFGRLMGVPVVVAHEHSWSFARNVLRYAIDRELVGRGADVLVAVSHADRARMIELEGIPSWKVRVIPNRIVPLPLPRLDLRAELGLTETAPVIGTLTVLRPEKALDVLIEAAALLTREFPDLSVLIAGAGPEEERLRSRIRQHGLERTVRLIGFRPNVEDVLASVDVAIFSSDREGSPLAVMEAMAAGKPIVATRVGGIPALVKHEQHALLAPRRDASALAEAVTRLLRDRELRERLGRNARERQRRDFDIESTVRAVEDLYDQLFAASGRGRREALTDH